METSLAFPICSASAACRTWERMPEYSTSRVCSSIPSGASASCVSMGMPSKPITLAAKDPFTLPQICWRSSLKAMCSLSSPAILNPRQELPQQRDLPFGRRQLREAAPGGLVASLREPPEDLAGPADQSLPHVQLGERERHRSRSVTPGAEASS